MKKGRSITRSALTLIVLFSTVLAAAMALPRHRAEAKYREVAVCIDFREGLAFARRMGIPPDRYFADLAKLGVGWLAIEEDTLRTLAEAGDIWLMSGSEFAALVAGDAEVAPRAAVAADGAAVAGGNGDGNPHAWSLEAWTTVVVPMTEEGAALLASRLHVRLHPSVDVRTVPWNDTQAYIISLPMGEAGPVNLGIRPSSIALASRVGMDVVVRFSNWPGISEKWIDIAVREAAAGGGRRIAVFSGTEIMGYPALVRHTARALASHDIAYGDIEFSPQAGAAEIIAGLGGDFVRVHSISRAEVDKGLSVDTMVERYVRAARERNIRLMYTRPLNRQLDSRQLEELNREFFSKLSESLVDAGFGLGHPGSLDRIGAGLLPAAGLVLGIAAAGLLIVDLMCAVPLAIAAGLLAVAAAGFAGLWAMGYEVLSRQAAALAAAVLFPSLSAFVLLKPFDETPQGFAGWAWAALKRLVVASACSVSGGLVLAACITTSDFMLKANQFLGVKLMHVAPFATLLLAYWHYYVRRPGESWLRSIVRIANSPVLLWHAAAAAVIAALGLVYIVRTGNTSSISLLPSSAEQAMRAILERVLPARPRTKEFLIGHPAFIASIGLLAAGGTALLLPASALAMIGQVSIVNTFAHLHTPIGLTLVRVALGLALGAAVGLVAAPMVVWAYRLANRSLRSAG